jgi:hypothetical protein
VSQFNLAGDSAAMPDIVREAVKHHDTPLSMAYFAACRTSIVDKGYAVLDNLGDPLSKAMLGSTVLPFTRPSTIPTEDCTQFFNGIYDTFDLDDALKNTSTDQRPWYPIFNKGATLGDQEDQAHGHARFSTTCFFTTHTLLASEDTGWMARFRAFLDLYIGMLCKVVDIHAVNDRKMFLPKSGGRFLLTGEHCPAQTGHNDFDHTDSTGPGLFVIVTGTEDAHLWVASGSHKHVHEPDARKRKMASVIRMTRIDIPRHSVFIGHGFLQHAGAEWTGNHSLRYHVYIIPEGNNLKDTVYFAYTWSLKKEGDKSSTEDDDAVVIPITPQVTNDDQSQLSGRLRRPPPLEDDGPQELSGDEYDDDPDDEDYSVNVNDIEEE